MKRSRRSRVAEESTAYHEAGHLVAAYFLRVPFAKVAATIIPDEARDSSGRFINRFMFQAGELESGDSDRTKLKAERLAQVCLAGMVAWHASGDYRTAHELVSMISGSRAEGKAYLNLILVRA